MHHYLITRAKLAPDYGILEGLWSVATEEGGEYMHEDGWSIGAFWVLLSKDSCLTEIGGINGNGNCDELDGNG